MKRTFETRRVFEEAVRASREGPTQYFLVRNDEAVRCEYGQKLLDYLRNGWTFRGRCISGALYRTYLLRKKKRRTLEYIEKIFGVSVPEPENVDYIMFMFATCFGEKTETSLHIIIVERDGTESQINRPYSEKLELVINFLDVDIQAKQYTDELIARLEIDTRIPRLSERVKDGLDNERDVYDAMRELCYELYKRDWCKSRKYPIISVERANARDEEYHGEMFACLGEFEDCEFRDSSYMEYLFKLHPELPFLPLAYKKIAEGGDS